jgi:hypothetical protein
MSVLFFFFFLINLGLYACKAGTLLFEPNLLSILIQMFSGDEVSQNFLTEMALVHNPSE